MNILIFAHDSSMYGASRSLLTALIGLSKEGYNLLVLLPYEGNIEQCLRKESIEYRIVPFPRCVMENKKTNSFLKNAKAFYNYKKKVYDVMSDLDKAFESFKPDVIYTNTSVVAVGYHLSKKNNIPHVWHVREFSNFYDFRYLPNLKVIKKQLLKSKEIVFGSVSLLNHWIKDKRTNSTVVYNGILENDETLHIKKEGSNPNIFKRFGIVGAITKGKGQHLAIEAFAEIQKESSGAILNIYGDVIDQDYFKFLSSLIQKLDLSDRVIFKGFIESKDDIYNHIDVLLSCSQMEGFGRTIVEAMGFGIPVIANASGGVLEIIDDKVNGLLFDGTVTGLVSAINLLNDPGVYTNLSVNGFYSAKEKYSIKRYVEQIENVLKKAIENK